jgi:choline dehydrogenase-like flavoprotein
VNFEARSGEEIRGRRIEADAVVVGSGAGGATTAQLLSDCGLDVVLLEEGGRHGPRDFIKGLDECMRLLYRDAGLTPILGSPPIAFAEGCCLGGSTVINGALCWRTPGHVLERWRASGLPLLGEADLDPVFRHIEQDLSIAVQDDNATNAVSRLLVAGARELNWRYEHVPRAQRECRGANRCPTGCPTGAKQSMLETYIPRAAANGTRIFTHARVGRIVREGKEAVGVAGRTLDGSRFHVRAKDVFLCCGAVQTPYLLQRSGLGTGLGRTLRMHFNCKAVAVFREEIAPQAGTMMTAQVKEFAAEDMYIGGSNFHPAYIALTLAGHGPRTVARTLAEWQRVGIYLTQVKCSGAGRIMDTRLGRPLARYVLLPEDVRRIRLSLQRLCQLLFAAGAVEVFLPLAGAPAVHSQDEAEGVLGRPFRPDLLDVLTVHVMGSSPMSSDPAAPVDAFGSLRACPNVHVCDASVLPGATGVNPQVTIMAMVWRNVRDFLERRGKSCSSM